MITRPNKLCKSLWKEGKQVQKKLLFCLVALVLVALPLCAACAQPAQATKKTPPTPPTRAIDPIVSTQWLEDNAGTPDLVILDVREPDLYAAGHIPGSINVPALGNFYLCLFDPDCGLWMELPEDEALFTTIGDAGITGDSLVVVVGRTVDPFAAYAVADAARVAITLIYAGVDNVAMLNGGYDKWAAEGRTTPTAPVKPTAVTYTGTADKTMFVTKDYVEKKVTKPKKSTLVEAREADIYFGLIQEPWTVRAGHIPSAKDLPAPWFWAFEVDEGGVITYGTWKDTSAIREMALAVLGEDASEEIIVYCGVGGYASPVWFALTQMIGYTNAKIYDGSMQEWSADPNLEVIKYRYQ
jgi:thiosulfate/3-mercaptopyruvate sulfurtransferase